MSIFDLAKGDFWGILHSEVEGKFKSLLRDPNERDKNGTPLLIHAARNRQANILAILLKAGADPNIIDSLFTNESPLYTAVEKGHEDIMRTLIEAGADINIGMKGRSIWSIAAGKKHSHILKALRELFPENEKEYKEAMASLNKKSTKSVICTTCGNIVHEKKCCGIRWRW